MVWVKVRLYMRRVIDVLANIMRISLLPRIQRLKVLLDLERHHRRRGIRIVVRELRCVHSCCCMAVSFLSYYRSILLSKLRS